MIHYLLDSSASWRILRMLCANLRGPLICATAAHHDLVALHDDSDFATTAWHLPDLQERAIRDTPQPD